MNGRRAGILILCVGVIVGIAAIRIGIDPLVAGGAVIVVGLLALIVVVVRSASVRMAANRVELMRAAQMCPQCGYSIRVPGIERCPECGLPVIATPIDDG